MEIADVVPVKYTLTLAPGRFHRVPHDLKDVLVEIRDRDGNRPIWNLGNVGLGPMVTVHPHELTIELPGDAEGLTATIVGLPRSA